MSKAARSKLFDVTVHLHHETYPGERDAGAILVSDMGNRSKAVWLPKAQVEFEIVSGAIIKVTLPEWLAIDKGLA